MATRKNQHLSPILLEELVVGKYYSVIHFTDPSKDNEGAYLGDKENPRILTEKGELQTPVKEYVFYPISINRKLLKRFGIEVSVFNRTFPARNSAAYKAVPNYKRSKRCRQTRKRANRGRHSRFA